jgi:uncharacterized protein YkwD
MEALAPPAEAGPVIAYSCVTMRSNPLTALVLLAICTRAAASDLYGAINRLRAGETTCARAADLPPLTVRPQLERAAAALARGGALATSIRDTGYRATHAAYINVSGGASERDLLAILQSHYCAQMLDRASTDIGIYQNSSQLWIVLAVPFAPRVAESEETAGQKILALVNSARAASRNCGGRYFKAASPLRWNNTLARASRLHAEDMARFSYFSHEGKDGSGPAQRVERAGYRYRTTGENIAAGPMTSEDVVADWLKSPPHCANVMNPAYTEMGVAFAVSAASEMGVYWAQEFGMPR